MALNNIGLFHLDNQRITILGTNEEPWFIAKEIGQLLGIVNYHYIIAKLEDYQKGLHTMITLGGTQKVSIINESGLYEMIFNSRKEEAKRFKKWVFNEVLPSIRKRGKYELQERLIELEIENEEKMLLLQESEEKNEELRETIRSLQYLSDNRDNQVLLTERIIELGYISRRDISSISMIRYIDRGNRMCPLQHPDFKIFIGHLAKISSIISKRKKQLHGEYPPISREHRNNIYYLNDYVEFGDEVIHRYFTNRPFDEWGIDTTWMNHD